VPRRPSAPHLRSNSRTRLRLPLAASGWRDHGVGLRQLGLDAGELGGEDASDDLEGDLAKPLLKAQKAGSELLATA
jgi:hypothetical protein